MSLCGKAPITEPEEDRNSSEGVIRQGEVDYAIAIEVPGRHRPRTVLNTKTVLEGKAPVTHSQQHRYATREVIRHCQVKHAVAVEICRDQRRGLSTYDKAALRSEG